VASQQLRGNAGVLTLSFSYQVVAINCIAVTIAMYCVIQFYVQLREPLGENKPFLKVLAIKLVIFFSFWQTVCISVSTSTLNLVHPNQVLAYPDIKVGIPALLLCFEMALFAVLHLWAFPYAPYVPGAKRTFYPAPDARKADLKPPRENEHSAPQGGFLGLKAFWDALNLWDFVCAFGRGLRWLFCGVKRRKEDISYKNRASAGVDMDDLRRKEGNTSYDAMRPGAKSTEHLPIAHEFRRSTFGLPSQPGGRHVREESAGLIAHAQPNPVEGGVTSPYRGVGGPAPPMSPYRDQRFDDGGASRQGEYNARDEEEQRWAPESSGKNPRDSTQIKVGQALWGPQGNPR
jgi:hypothetical protein